MYSWILAPWFMAFLLTNDLPGEPLHTHDDLALACSPFLPLNTPSRAGIFKSFHALGAGSDASWARLGVLAQQTAGTIGWTFFFGLLWGLGGA